MATCESTGVAGSCCGGVGSIGDSIGSDSLEFDAEGVADDDGDVLFCSSVGDCGWSGSVAVTSALLVCGRVSLLSGAEM